MPQPPSQSSSVCLPNYSALRELHYATVLKKSGPQGATFPWYLLFVQEHLPIPEHLGMILPTYNISRYLDMHWLHD